MSVASPLAAYPPPRQKRLRLTRQQYQAMIAQGILTDEHPVELLDGLLVFIRPKNPPHEESLRRLLRILSRVAPPGWLLQIQMAVEIEHSQPEPDAPLARDRNLKLPLYARARMPTYVIVDLDNLRVELHSQPDPATGTYTRTTTLLPAQSLTLTIAEHTLPPIPVADLLP